MMAVLPSARSSSCCHRLGRLCLRNCCTLSNHASDPLHPSAYLAGPHLVSCLCPQLVVPKSARQAAVSTRAAHYSGTTSKVFPYFLPIQHRSPSPFCSSVLICSEARSAARADGSHATAAQDSAIIHAQGSSPDGGFRSFRAPAPHSSISVPVILSVHLGEGANGSCKVARWHAPSQADARSVAPSGKTQAHPAASSDDHS